MAALENNVGSFFYQCSCILAQWKTKFSLNSDSLYPKSSYVAQIQENGSCALHGHTAWDWFVAGRAGAGGKGS